MTLNETHNTPNTPPMDAFLRGHAIGQAFWTITAAVLGYGLATIPILLPRIVIILILIILSLASAARVPLLYWTGRRDEEKWQNEHLIEPLKKMLETRMEMVHTLLEMAEADQRPLLGGPIKKENAH